MHALETSLKFPHFFTQRQIYQTHPLNEVVSCFIIEQQL